MIDNSRRPVATRKIHFFHNLASRLVRVGLHPNHISVMSAVFGLISGLCFYLAGDLARPILFSTLAIIGIQLRLVCNLIDGLMAVEGGLKTPTGEIYNDLPDRISDVAILLGFAYGAQNSSVAALGWAAAVGAIMTAYIRVLGASMGAGHFFSGPMAKQHRMFLLTLAGIIWATEQTLYQTSFTVITTLVIVIIGTLITCLRRLYFIGKKLS